MKKKAPVLVAPTIRGAAKECRITYLPNDQLIVVLATERSKVLLVAREGQALDVNLVQLQSVQLFQRVEVPNDDLSLHTALAVLVSVLRIQIGASL